MAQQIPYQGQSSLNNPTPSANAPIYRSPSQNPNNQQSSLTNITPPASKPRLSGGGGGGNKKESTDNSALFPESITSQYPNSLQQLEQAKENMGQGFRFTDKGASARQHGTLITSPTENLTTQKPYYQTQSRSDIDAISEGAMVGQTYIAPAGKSPTEKVVGFFSPNLEGTGAFQPKGQKEYNLANINTAKELSTESISFQNNPQSFLGKEGVFGMSTLQGESIDASKYFESKYGSEDYRKNKLIEARNTLETQKFDMGVFKGVSSSDAGRLSEGFTALTGAGLGLVEFGGTAVQFAFQKESRGLNLVAGWKANKVEFDYGKTLSNIPTSQSLSDRNGFAKFAYVPVDILLNQPARATNIGLNIAMVSSVAGDVFKGYKAGKALYSAERELGASKLGALNVVGGEALWGGVLREQRIYITGESKLSPYKTTQANKGDLLTFTKIGDTPTSQLYTGTGMLKTITPKETYYFTVKPKLTGLSFRFSSADTSTGSIVSLRQGNIFAMKPTQNENVFKTAGTGQRDVLQFGYTPVQTSRYTLGTSGFLQKDIQQFTTLGKAIKTDKGFDISYGKSKFKPIERYSYTSGYRSFGKDILPSASRQGKAFGAGISGRPSKSKSFDIYKQVNNVEGNDMLGISIGKSISGGRKQVSLFKVKTVMPESKGFSISFANPTEVNQFKGLTTKSTYSKGEFDYLGSQKSIQTPMQSKFVPPTSTLSPPSTRNTFSTQIMKPSQSFGVKSGSSLKTGLMFDTASKSSFKSNFGLSSLGKSVRPISMDLLSSGTATKQASDLGLGSASASRSSSAYVNIPAMTSSFGFGGSSSGFDYKPQKPINPIGFFGGGFSFPDYIPSLTRKPSKRKYKRTPSFIATQLGIKSTRQAAGESTGLVVRPILTSTRRKK